MPALDVHALRPDTAEVWQRLAAEPLLRDFVLVGGTALALRIGHRVSEDLDFAFLGDRLPGVRLQRLIAELSREGVYADRAVDPVAEEDFAEAGLTLSDYQQNYVLNDRVKMTFVVLDAHVRRILRVPQDSLPRVASLDEIFRLKALVCADRSKSRDWLDVYVLMHAHGYTMSDFHQAFVDSECPSKFDIAKMRLLSGKPQAGDEGYESLIQDSAPTIDDLRNFFSVRVDAFEAERFAAAQSGCVGPWQAPG